MTSRAQKLAQTFGCGDNSCMFGRPGGMGTNGGCQCFASFRHRPHYEDRTKLRQVVRALREAIELLDKADPDGPTVADLVDRLVRYQSGENQIIDRVWKPRVEELEELVRHLKEGSSDA